MTYRLEPLSEDHELGGFDCGTAGLTTWLRDNARNARGQGTRTYVLVDEVSRAVVGYVAIAPHMIERDDLPARMARGAPSRIPAILLGKLAVDLQIQGRGLGGDLLTRTLEMIIGVARVAGGKVVVVDAIDEPARAFYAHHDFESCPGQPMRLVMKISTVAKALRLAWP